MCFIYWFYFNLHKKFDDSILGVIFPKIFGMYVADIKTPNFAPMDKNRYVFKINVVQFSVYLHKVYFAHKKISNL